MGQGKAQAAAARLVERLDGLGVPYAIIGGLALGQYGHVRATLDVDVLLRPEGLSAFKAAHLGHGYAERVPGTGKLLDTELDVNVGVLETGRFPGDGLPKPVAFPDPSAAIRGRDWAVLPLAAFLELKLASGMTAPHRLKDLADVLEIVRTAALPRRTADDLHPYVRSKFDELWVAAQTPDPYG